MKKFSCGKKLVQTAIFSLMCVVGFSACASSKVVEKEAEKKVETVVEEKKPTTFVTVDELTEGRNELVQKFEIDESKYEEVFFDDFASPVLDSEKWERCPEWERQAHMKNHGSWSDKCSYCWDGCLVLESKKDMDGRLISGGVRTKSKYGEYIKFQETKGVYEIKFKVEKGSGYWYAFWLMAGNDEAHIGNGATNGAELDCFEILPGKSMWKYNGRNSFEEGRMMTTIHWDAYGSAHKSRGTDGIKVTDFDENFYDNWHVYQFVWSDTTYDCYLDGKLLWSMNAEEYGGMCEVPGYMKITAEFGDWGGPIDPVITEGGAKRMLVDYVKVYKQK